MERDQKKRQPAKILVVDDIVMNVEIMQEILESEGYEVMGAYSVQEALDMMNRSMPQLILSDFTMPGMNGLEFCRLLQGNPRTRDIPFIFITVSDTAEDKAAAYAAGVVDFIPKPFEPIEVIMRVNNQINNLRIKADLEEYNRMMHKMMEEQKRHIEREQENILLALVKVLARRDDSLEKRLELLGYNCRILAQSLQLMPRYEDRITDEFVETIETASKLYDIGKVLSSDERLTCDDGADGQSRDPYRHAREGARVLEEIRGVSNASRFLDMAILIARYHHARWDGTGYPEGVGGEDIPLAARIVAIVKDFGVLMWGSGSSEKRYSQEESIRILNEKSGSLYDPDMVDIFNRVLRQLRTD